MCLSYVKWLTSYPLLKIPRELLLLIPVLLITRVGLEESLTDASSPIF
jgi:hypothetical protein